MSATPQHAPVLPVHPHQLEVQEFDTYELILDLRAAQAYALDHLPRAVSVPCVESHGAEVPAAGVTGAAMGQLVAMEPAAGVPYAIRAHLDALAPGSTVLLYCDQGGAVSAGVASQIAARGFAVDVLPGGWASYRRWVTTGVEVLARALDWRWVRSGPGGVSQAVAAALRARGEQVVSMDGWFEPHSGLARVPGLVLDMGRAGGARDSTSGLASIPALDTRLVDELRRLDPSERVWIDEAFAASGEQLLPTPLHEALRHAPAWRIEASPDCRAELLCLSLGASGGSGGAVESLAGNLMRALQGGQGGGRRVDRAEKLLATADEHGALAALLNDVFDPLYESLSVRSAPGRERSVVLASSMPADLERLASQLIAAQIRP